MTTVPNAASIPVNVTGESQAVKLDPSKSCEVTCSRRIEILPLLLELLVGIETIITHGVFYVFTCFVSFGNVHFQVCTTHVQLLFYLLTLFSTILKFGKSWRKACILAGSSSTFWSRNNILGAQLRSSLEQIRIEKLRSYLFDGVNTI